MPITATAADIDELGHVSNLVYVRWIFEVAMGHTRSVGWDFPQYKELGAVFVVRRHEVDYVSSVREGEQVIAETWVDSWKQVSVVRKTEIRRGDQVMVRGASVWAFLNIATGRPTRIPDELRALFV